MKNKKIIFGAVAIFIVLLIGIGSTPSGNNVKNLNVSINITENVVENIQNFDLNTINNDIVSNDETINNNSKKSVSLSDIPEYSNSPYVVINDNNPFFETSDLVTSSYEKYSNHDSIGRCGVAIANIGKDIMPTEDRGEIGSVKPSGWHSVRYQGIDGNYLYNRCHLIGFQLAGENANDKNLITGTRYLNVDGMLPFENMVADYVKETNNHVLYRVTPMYDGDNLVASGVLMEAESVEDSGKGIKFNVYCYNVQPGVTIDYKTGDSTGPEYTGSTSQSSSSQDTSQTAASTTTKTEQASQTSENDVTTTYVLNTNTKKFHRSSCSEVKKMSEKNKKESNDSRDSIINQGYVACSKCNP